MQKLFLSIRQLFNHKYFSILAGAILAVLLIVVSINLSREISKSDDYNVFYQAGINFSNKVSLYTGIGGAKRYIYPPFAAFCFQLFHIFSMNVAGGVWIFFNWIFWILTIRLTNRILVHFSIDQKTINWAISLGTICSLRYIWYHAMAAQMNLFVLYLSLLGVYYFLNQRQWATVTCLSIAIGIKILPIVVLGWLVTKSDYKFILKAIVAMGICFILPILFRGTDMGLADLKEYYVTFIEPFKQGRVEPDYQNYSLSAAIYKLTMPSIGEINPRGLQYNLFNIPMAAAQNIYKVLALLMLSLFGAICLYARFIAKKFFLYEISFVLIFTNLISGITWEYHFVSLQFILPIFFLTISSPKPLYKKLSYYAIAAFVLLNAIIGLDTVGVNLFYLSCGYSLLTAMLLLLLIDSSLNIFKKDVPSVTYHYHQNS